MKRILALLIVAAIAMCTVPAVAKNSDSMYDGYVVKFKDGYNPYGDARLMSVGGGEVETVIEDWNVYTVDADMIGSLDMSKVEYIEPNYKAVLLENYPNDPYYVSGNQEYYSMTGISRVWDMSRTQPLYLASGVKVAVIDSGIDINHPDFENTTIYAYDYSKSNALGEVIVSTDNVQEQQLHGTSVAGIIAAGFDDGIGIAGMTKATIYSLKVFGRFGADYANICKAIKDAVDEYDCDVINMSFGFTNTDGEVIPENEIQTLQDAIDNAADKGAIVVAASGNYGNEDGTSDNLPDGCRMNPIVYPAYCKNVISVGATELSGQVSDFSTYNDRVDVVAPGYGSMFLPRGKYKESDSYYCITGGTSIASPQVAAAAAIIKGVHPEVNQQGMEKLIQNLSRDLGTVGRDDYYGWGLLDVGKMAMLMSPNAIDVLRPSVPAYDAETGKLCLAYFNVKNTDFTGVATRVAIYNEDDTLVEITEPQNKIFPAYDEEEVTFEGIEIPDGGYAKVFCMDWSMIKPVAYSVRVDAIGK